MATTAPQTRRAAPMPPDERRAAIVAATTPLLIEHGPSVTTRQIAAAAGVSEGTLFNVFADKDQLVAAVFETAIDPAPYEAAVAAIDPRLTFDRRLVAAVELTQTRIVRIWRLVSQIGPHHHPAKGPLPDSPALVALFTSAEARLRIAPVEAARLLRALTLSLTHPMLAEQPHTPEGIVDLFLHGAASRRGRRT